jgi:hypothetical protein
LLEEPPTGPESAKTNTPSRKVSMLTKGRSSRDIIESNFW